MLSGPPDTADCSARLLRDKCAVVWWYRTGELRRTMTSSSTLITDAIEAGLRERPAADALRTSRVAEARQQQNERERKDDQERRDEYAQLHSSVEQCIRLAVRERNPQCRLNLLTNTPNRFDPYYNEQFRHTDHIARKLIAELGAHTPSLRARVERGHVSTETWTPDVLVVDIPQLDDPVRKGADSR